MANFKVGTRLKAKATDNIRLEILDIVGNYYLANVGFVQEKILRKNTQLFRRYVNDNYEKIDAK